MLSFAWLFLILAPQKEVAPFGWGCDVREDMSGNTRMAVSQTADWAGDFKYPRIVNVDYATPPGGPPAQSIQWIVEKDAKDLPRPDLLSLTLLLKKTDRKGEIRFDHDGGTISLPMFRLHRYSGHKASIHIDDFAVMEALSTTKHWSLSVRDRHGVVQGSVEGALPSAEATWNAFHRLAPILAGMIAAPQGKCDENDETAWI